MPRDGSGIYSVPAGTKNFQPNTSIESGKVNGLAEDLENDANNARPIGAGGTNASTAVQASDNLSTVGASIASAATTDLSAATGKVVTITGTTTITSFGTEQAGAERVLIFAAALVLTNSANLILPNGANITTAADAVANVISMGSGVWRLVSYSIASGGGSAEDAFFFACAS